MARVAVCVSGRIKNSQNAIEFIRQLQEDYYTFVFMHFWEENPRLKIQSWSKSDVDPLEEKRLRKAITHLKNVRFQQETFISKEKQFEAYRKTIKEDAFFNRWDVGIISMYYSIKQADSLRQLHEESSGHKFDCVFRVRFDSKPQKRFRLADYDLNSINIPNPEFDCGGINDRFAFGNSKHMSVYSTVYDHIKKLSEINGYQPEVVLKHHLRLNEIVPIRPDFPVLT